MSKLPDEVLRTIGDVLSTLGNGDFLDLESIAPKLQMEFVFGGHRMCFWSDDMGLTVHAEMPDSGEEAVLVVGYNEKTHKPTLDWQTEPTIDIRVAADVIVALMFGLAPFVGVAMPGDRH